MTKSIDFYFDFISPYSFLAYQKIKALNQNDLNINFKPVLLGGLHKLGEITAPAFNKRKLMNMIDDCNLIAKKNRIEFKWNSKFPINSLYLMRGYLIIDDKLKNEYFEKCFDAYWKDNFDILNESIVNKILKSCGIEKEKFFKDIQNEKTKEELKKLTKSAFDKNIFGAPTFIVNGKIFWGQARLDYALDEYNS